MHVLGDKNAVVAETPMMVTVAVVAAAVAAAAAPRGGGGVGWPCQPPRGVGGGRFRRVGGHGYNLDVATTDQATIATDAV